MDREEEATAGDGATPRATRLRPRALAAVPLSREPHRARRRPATPAVPQATARVGVPSTTAGEAAEAAMELDPRGSPAPPQPQGPAARRPETRAGVADDGELPSSTPWPPSNPPRRPPPHASAGLRLAERQRGGAGEEGGGRAYGRTAGGRWQGGPPAGRTRIGTGRAAPPWICGRWRRPAWPLAAAPSASPLVVAPWQGAVPHLVSRRRALGARPLAGELPPRAQRRIGEGRRPAVEEKAAWGEGEREWEGRAWGKKE
ncbi:hypothetical protein PVAP13_J685401 [Panicum virgatum]|nr:hypothetical protein PVAP13_J685401 [Panicum virgatum]